MKRVILIAAVLFLLLSGCMTQEPEAPAPVQPFTFYYQTVETDFSSPQGLIAPELRDLGEESLTDLELFQLYLLGPKRANLVCPVPKDTEVLSVSRSGSVLELRLSQAYNAQSGVYQSISDVCLAKTGLELEGIRQVRIRVESLSGRILRDVTLSDGAILLYDSGQTTENITVTLYFSDAGHQYLLSERRTVPYMEAAELPAYILELLLQGPQTEGLSPVMPQGTAILDLNVDEGLCSVDFNADFYNNRPLGQREEQLTVLSIVNTLCELSNVNRVQFYLEGSPLDLYSSLSLSAPFTMDSSVIGPIREELNEFEGILFLPDFDSSLLHRFPIRIRPRGSLSKAEALLKALFQRPSQNGLRNPLEGMREPVSVKVNNWVCTVELAEGSLPEDEDARQEILRCITATAESLDQIRLVTILEGRNSLTAEPIRPYRSWLLSAPD